MNAEERLAELDKDIAGLTADPSDIYSHWTHQSPLFQSRFPYRSLYGGGLACITELREPTANRNPKDDLGRKIKADTRLPGTAQEVTPEHFQLLKEYQLEADTVYGIRKVGGEVADE